MENKNQEMIHKPENPTSVNPVSQVPTPSLSSKTNWKFIAIVVALGVLVGGGILTYFYGNTPQIPSTIESKLDTCSINSDCVIVGSGGCCSNTFRAINKRYQEEYNSHPEWRMSEGELEECRRRFCAVNMSDVNSAQCVNSRCVLTKSVDIETSTWQTYRNEEFGFEVKYPQEWIIQPSPDASNKPHPDIFESSTKDISISITPLDSSTRGISLCEASLISALPPSQNQTETRCESLKGNNPPVVIDWEIHKREANALIRDLSITLTVYPPKQIDAETKEFFRTFLATFKIIEKVVKPQTQTLTPCPQMTSRFLPKKQIHTVITSGYYQDKFFVRFVDGSDIRLRDGKLVSLAGVNLDGLYHVLNQFTVKIERLYSEPEEKLSKELYELEAKTCKELPDLNLAYLFRVPSEQDNGRFIDLLNALSIVEFADPSPIPVNP